MLDSLLSSLALCGRLACLAAASLLAAGAGAQTLPVADAGPDQQIDCAPPEGVLVTLDGTGSSDPDDAAAVLTYTWTGEVLGVGESLDGPMPVFTAPPGTHTLTLTVDDGVDGTASDDVVVTVDLDVEPPLLVLTGEGAELWPPNHKYHPFTSAEFVADVSDDCDTELSAADVIFERVVSDEDENGRGDGNTTADVLLAHGCTDALIRAERQGPGDGRVYEATLAVSDAAGNTANAGVAISVPKSRGQGAASDSGDVYAVDSSSCSIVELCPALPDTDCVPAEGNASLGLREGRRSRLTWKAADFAMGDGDLGEGDAGTDYQLCVYVDDGAQIVLDATPAAPAGDGWRAGARGQSYRARRTAGPGLDKVRIRSNATESDVKLGSKGEDVELPELPVTDGATIVVQLHNSDGTCLETRFDDPHVNRPGRYKARSN